MSAEQDTIESHSDVLHEVAKALPDAPVAPAHGIAAIALGMAMKYHQMSMIPDGLTYQQYKMEGRNIREIGLVDVFETAQKIESWLLGASERIASLVVDAIKIGIEEDDQPQTDDPGLPEEKQQ